MCCHSSYSNMAQYTFQWICTIPFFINVNMISLLSTGLVSYSLVFHHHENSVYKGDPQEKVENNEGIGNEITVDK
uniref:AlNc14C158G7704 protein n=1 Tax=Albugo laibachii Nc14 TaxID=890382 RepID=F0WML6_9STRA|nr:AlNc14C158G7704 [Albugo laibachii Nc14]|eukprot:CCA22548.1 AlNc14C158G7704 [Albugo laibachii Nc14]